jgi:hypothetical protein
MREIRVEMTRRRWRRASVGANKGSMVIKAYRGKGLKLILVAS